MLQRTSRILIGKDIDRDAQVVGGATLATITLSTGLADGEIVVLDKTKKVLNVGDTIAESDIIYVCQGTGDTFSYTNEAGTTVTGARKILISDPIEGAKVKKFVGKTFVAKTERTASVDFTGLTPAVGTEYLVRIIYKDVNEHPGQFTQTYRYVSTTATLDTWGAALEAVVNAHSGRRVLASYTAGTDVFLLTGLPKPECTTGLTDIDEFSMVDFDVRFLYVDTSGNWQTISSTSTTVTYAGPTFGSGNWEQVRDLEKEQLGYSGVTNRTKFPVILPTVSTVKSATYNLIVIESDKTYLSPDNQYVKQAPLTTIVALPIGALQTTNVLGCLNAWVASCPGAFSAVVF